MKLYRTYQPKQTIGKLCFEGHELSTVELVWADNTTRKSCIPEGTYKAVPRFSEKFGHHFHVIDVPGRDLILFHPANYSRQLLGCIAVGMAHKDIDKDGLIDVVESKKAMAILLEKFPYGFDFEICEK